MGLEAMVWNNYGKIILLLLIITMLLQAYHMTYLMKLQEIAKEKEAREIASDATREVVNRSIDREDLLMYMDMVERAHVMDSTGSYMIVPNIVTPISDSDDEAIVTLCSQTSTNHIHYLKELTETWQGPISVTVFTHGEDTAYALYSIAYMHACFDRVKLSVRFHIAYPIRDSPIYLKRALNSDFHCDTSNFRSLLIEENTQNYENFRFPYPHNVLRNIAIEHSLTPYVFLIDIDMLPSNDLLEHFTYFIKRTTSESRADNDKVEKLAYVIPSFESANYNRIGDKKSLLQEWKLQNVRPFYANVCWKCQVLTSYERWRGLPDFDFMDIGYILEWEEPWEPFYIAEKENLPLYDGRFKQYGFNRISQVCELHVAGYQFAILNNAFLMHRGFKEPDSFHKQKTEENDRNRELFRAFKKDLKDRYPQSNREC